MRFVPEFCSLGLIFLWMSYIDYKTGFVYRFQSYLAMIAGSLIYIKSAVPVMYIQLFLYLSEIIWLVKKDYIGRGDGYVYSAMALSFSGITDSGSYLLCLFIHQLLANLVFAVKLYRQKKLPAVRLGADHAFIPSLFYSWLSLVASFSVFSFSGR